MTTITSKIDGFRRCGVAHPKTATEYPDGAFTEEQLVILQAEPNLVVVVSGSQSPPAAGKPLSAAELIAKIKEAATVEEIVTILGEDKRATVLAAAEARNAELNSPAE